MHLGEIPAVMCHPGEVSQVLLNLLVNAAHAIAARNGDGGPRGTITVTTRAIEDSVVISIRDTGTGIAEHVRNQIFDPFFTTKPVGQGSGQGLAIARGVVDKHRGSLTFETELGQGTTFHVRLPISQSAAALAA